MVRHWNRLPREVTKCSKPGWMGLWETWSSGRCPCLWRGVGKKLSVKSFQLNPFQGSEPSKISFNTHFRSEYSPWVSTWSLVRHATTYILQLLLIWTNTPGWGNLPGLNHSKLGWKKEKHFNISDLCYARIASIMFFSFLNAPDCSKPSFSMHWKSPQCLQIQGGLWRFENISHLHCPEFRFLCPAKAIVLLLLHRFHIKFILKSQLIIFFPVSNYLILYCCVYRHLNPCRKTEPQRIPYGSTMMACSGITSEQYWLTKQQHSLYIEGFQSSTEEQLCLFSC